MSRKEFTDRQGRLWRPDPTGRFTFRALDGERWTAAVCMVRGQAPGSDPEGESLLADGVGESLDPDDPRADVFADRDGTANTAVAAAPATSSRPWRHRVAHTSFTGLEQWLDEQGRAGWELVSILPGTAAGSSTTDLIAVFKRAADD